MITFADEPTWKAFCGCASRHRVHDDRKRDSRDGSVNALVRALHDLLRAFQDLVQRKDRALKRGDRANHRTERGDESRDGDEQRRNRKRLFGKVFYFSFRKSQRYKQYSDMKVIET